MIEIMTRLEIHLASEGARTQPAVAEACGVGVRSVQRIMKERRPTREDLVAGELLGGPRRGRPPKADEALCARVAELLKEEPSMMAVEVWRRAKSWGYQGGRSAMCELVKRLRPPQPKEPLVRFEGLPGEYTQFDFGEGWVKYLDGRREKFIFFAGRLKCSRVMHVVPTANQQAETLARALVGCLEAFGGSTKEWVFDNPKTIRLSAYGVKPVVLHPFMRDLVAEYDVTATFCAPRSGNQKGSVENLVGFVKKNFLFARKFKDREDVERQLDEWLREVNTERPCAATNVIPAEKLAEELPWLAKRPLIVSSDQHALRQSATVGLDGTVSVNGTPYFVSAEHVGATATILLRRQEIAFVLQDHGGVGCVHIRRDRTKTVQRQPGQRGEMLEILHGRRKRATFKRQCVYELGEAARAFLTGLIHGCGCWEGACAELYDLMQAHGDDVMARALAQCVAEGRHTVTAVAEALVQGRAAA